MPSAADIISKEWCGYETGACGRQLRPGLSFPVVFPLAYWNMTEAYCQYHDNANSWTITVHPLPPIRYCKNS